MSFVADAKWSCPKCGVVIPYNPTYNMKGKLCATCAAYDNADRLLGGYRSEIRR